MGLYNKKEETRKHFESQVMIVDYKSGYHKAFKDLNEEWITQHFEMEESDHQALDHPEEHIINKGGHIYIALYEGEAVGGCAIIKMNDHMFELAKMAVSPKAQGKSIGTLLAQACIAKAKELGADTIFLESNTKLEAAISLYHKLGFEEVSGRPSHYDGANIQMELKLT